MAYDVLIKGGRVIDPASDTDATLDVALQDGRIARVAADIDASEAERWVDARGKLVVPGLIDVHAHIFEHGSSNGLDPDLAGVRSGVTTIVDAGSAGSSNYNGFHHLVIQRAVTRVLTNIHIAKAGLAFMPEARDENDILLDDTIAMINAHRGEIIGVKIRACGPAVDAMGIGYVESALTAAQEGGVRLMVHIGDPQSTSDPTITRQLLPLLRPNDLLTHLYTGHPGKAIDDANRVLPELVDAKDRGVLFDPAHGRWNLSFEVAKRMLDQDIAPASISTDITRPGRDIVKSMTHTMGKFLALGFSLQEVIRMSTLAPARMIGQEAELGSLAEGTIADVTILDAVQGRWRYSDSERVTLIGEQALQPVLTFKGGEQHAVDYGPFPWGWLPETGE